MSFSTIRLSQQHGSGRRRGRFAVDVECMETRALLTSAAVNSAIGSIVQAGTYVQQQIGAEIATLESNIVTIEQSTAVFEANYAKGDKTLTDLAVRDEKYAIGQQLFLIDLLESAQKQYASTLNAGIGGLKDGRLDPRTIPNILTAADTVLTTELGAVDAAATYELDGLVGTFAAGKT